MIILLILWEKISKINNFLNMGIDSKEKIDEKFIANGDGYLKISPYLISGYQSVHPSLIYFDKPWNGYKYWLAITPYRKENEKLENPCVMCSNDLFSWKKPKKGINPLISTKNIRLYHYSDPHILFNNNKLEIWYRKRTRGILGDSEIILRKSSYDGVNWSTEEVLHKSVGTFNQFMSPVVIIENNKYCIWVADWENKILKYYESKDGADWEFVRDIRIAPIEERYVWHMDIKKTIKGYEMYFSAALGGYNDQKIAYCYSEDNISWTIPIIVMEKGSEGAFDDDFLYRPTFIDIDNNRYIMYSARNRKSNWHCSITTCSVDEPIKLIGIIIKEKRVKEKHFTNERED